MELTEFTLKFAECFNSTETNKISANTKFRELDEWGSMMALIVIAMVDSEYSKTLTAEDLKAAKTLSELFEIVRNK